MIKELQKVSEIFLTDVDHEDYEENKQTLIEWEQGLAANRLFLSWQNHDTTRQIANQAKESYKAFCLQLIQDRALSEQARMSIYAKQDACLFILQFTEKDALGEIKEILRQVEVAVSSFK